MEQLIPQLADRITEQEYLRMEESARTKHEFRHGRMIDMAGATTDHVRIATNLSRQIGNRLEGRPCEAYGSDLRVRINESGSYYYPDVTVVCGSVEYARPDRRTTIINPKVVIEVTSPSTEADDRGDKFNDYRRIGSLQEYVLISQERVQVETFHRQPEGLWVIGPTVTELNQSVKFRSLDIEISLSEIYARVELSAVPVENRRE